MSRARSLVPLALSLLAGCTVGPDYRKPDAPTAAAFKELAGWRIGQPQDQIDRGAWWSVYRDPVLDGLERQVVVSNQTLKQAEAAYRAAVAAALQARAGLLPSVTGTASGVREPTIGVNKGLANEFTLELGASWDPDVWGRIRRTVEAGVATAQADAADVANARLSAQAQLAIDYFSLRAEDALHRLLAETAIADKRSLTITENQYQAGVAAKADVITAEVQLAEVVAQEINVGVQRAQLEHAIAALVGKPPDGFSIASAPLAGRVPVAPTGVASALLERRPDIAAAERAMQAANAQIGVAVAAFYPDLTLSGAAGFANNELGGLLAASNRIWSLGASATGALYQGGALEAAEAEARANYDASVANYRQTVLTAFQGVEDQLVALRVLERQAVEEDKAIRLGRQAVEITLNEYRAGTVAYTAVVTAQANLLSDEQLALTVRQDRLIASVTLIEDLGGGWMATDLPSRDEILTDPPGFNR